MGRLSKDHSQIHTHRHTHTKTWIKRKVYFGGKCLKSLHRHFQNIQDMDIPPRKPLKDFKMHWDLPFSSPRPPSPSTSSSGHRLKYVTLPACLPFWFSYGKLWGFMDNRNNNPICNICVLCSYLCCFSRQIYGTPNLTSIFFKRCLCQKG